VGPAKPDNGRVIRVVIADDHGVVRAGLEQLLMTFEDVEVVASAANGREAVEMCASLSPDLVLMDLEMPVMDGIDATREIVAGQSACPVVALTSFSDRKRIIAVLEAGAVGYLLKDVSAAELERGIRAAVRGESPLDPKAARALIDRGTDRDELAGLSPRELQVLGLIGAGLPNKIIARRLEISEKTVKAHLTSIFRQLGVTDRTQAALWAQRHDLGG
jgi:DNA-binding NarL/FixJ family response regulator